LSLRLKCCVLLLSMLLLPWGSLALVAASSLHTCECCQHGDAGGKGCCCDSQSKTLCSCMPFLPPHGLYTYAGQTSPYPLAVVTFAVNLFSANIFHPPHIS
jgi:hypothetical protein